MTSDIISYYFPRLNDTQKEQFRLLKDLYHYWNSQINVISRKDIDQLYLHHILHSLAIAKVVSFKPDENILDVGTGGGFPGIPLAILFPETKFHLVDSIGKKIKVVDAVSQAINLLNVRTSHARVEDIDEKFDFIMSRAVTQLKDFYPWIKNKFNTDSKNELKNGVLYLKGGDLSQEIRESGLKNVRQFPINAYFEEEFFDSKYVLYFSEQ